MQEDTEDSLFLAVKHFFSGTMLSRITGMLRDMTMAFFFGSSPLIAAFMMAFRFSNLLRRIFGEGPLQSAFIPHFEEMRKQSPEDAKKFFKDVKISVLFLLVLLSLLVEIILICFLFFADLQESNAQILKLTAYMFPSIIFICLYGINASLLQCEHKFFISGVAPVAFNLIWIASVFFFRDVVALTFSVILATFFQWALTLPATIHFLKQTPYTLFSPAVRRLAKPLALGIVGVSAAQINSTLDPIFARATDLEGPAFLWYAIRIQQLPLALLAIAFSGALLPSLSRAFKSADMSKFFSLLHFGLKRSFALMIPITFAFLALGASCTLLLYGHGDFSDRAIKETAFCLYGYTIGLLPMTATLLFASAYYAQNNFAKSAKASLLSMLLNISLNYLFIFPLSFSTFSVAFATSLASLFNCLYMLRTLPKSPFPSGIRTCIWRTFIASLIASVPTLFVGYLLGDPTLNLLLQGKALFPREFGTQLTLVLFEGVTFLGTLLVASLLLKANDLLSIFRKQET